MSKTPPKPPKPTVRSCPTCRGKGTVTRSYKDEDGKWKSEEKTCGQCNGTGQISF